MIQRSHRCPPATRCEQGHSPRLIEILGKRKWYVECAPCSVRGPQRDSQDEALAAYRAGLVVAMPKSAERQVIAIKRRTV